MRYTCSANIKLQSLLLSRLDQIIVKKKHRKTNMRTRITRNSSDATFPSTGDKTSPAGTGQKMRFFKGIYIQLTNELSLSFQCACRPIPELSRFSQLVIGRDFFLKANLHHTFL